MSISGSIKRLQDIMRMDDGINGDAQRLEQIVWILFLKLFDIKEKESENITIIEGNDYTSIIPSNLRWSQWAEYASGLTGDSLLKFVDNELFPGLKELKGNTVKHQIVRDIFKDTHNYMKNGTLLRQVINLFNEVDLSKSSDRHDFNDVYETLLKSLQSAGNSGEFYTPRPLTEFIVEMVSPKVDEKIHDFACGTGGFLTSTIEYLEKSGQVNSIEAISKIEKNVSGIEKKQLPHALCMTNLILHGFDTPNIYRSNSLQVKPQELENKDLVDVIVTNPPYGGKEEVGILSNFPSEFRSSETADLFMYLLMEKLTINGRAGIVLPDSILFGDGVKNSIKEKLLSEFDLHTIIRLPNGVFSPYTSISTNLLFFNKGKSTEGIWYYQMPIPSGLKNGFTKTNPITNLNFDEIRSWWNNRQENENVWYVKTSDIKNFNLDLRNPNTKTEEKESTIEELVSDLRTTFTKNLELVSRLEAILNDE